MLHGQEGQGKSLRGHPNLMPFLRGSAPCSVCIWLFGVLAGTGIDSGQVIDSGSTR